MAEEVTWHSLPAEVQGRILAEIDDEERCKVVPPLSKKMHDLHKTHPPARRRWVVDCTITPPMIEWSVMISGHLEELIFTKPSDYQDLQPHLLMAVRNAPRLRSITLEGPSDPAVLCCFAFLGKIRKLDLKGYRASGVHSLEPSIHPLSSLTHLKALEEGLSYL